MDRIIISERDHLKALSEPIAWNFFSDDLVAKYKSRRDCYIKNGNGTEVQYKIINGKLNWGN